MMRSTLFILIITLVFTGCAERGSVIDIRPKTEVSKTVENKKEDFPVLKLSSSREDKVEEVISGSLILVIGLLLIL